MKDHRIAEIDDLRVKHAAIKDPEQLVAALEADGVTRDEQMKYVKAKEKDAQLGKRMMRL